MSESVRTGLLKERGPEAAVAHQRRYATICAARRRDRAVTGRSTVTLATRNEADRFNLVWEERGGPRVEGEPQRVGFGSSLATVSVEAQLGGRLERVWDPVGLRVTADLPVTALSRRRAAQNVA